MLVLSRGQTDKIVFPNLDITIEVLRIEGNRVRVGINAPKDISVLRHEIAQKQARAEGPARCRPSDHALRNRLNTANLALHLLQRQLDAGQTDAAESTLQHALRELDTLNASMDASTPDTSDPRPTLRALLVEDDANESELLAAYLQMSGFEVDRAMDGLQAMIYLSRHRSPDIVLLDMMMPRMDGPKTISKIRSDPAYREMKIFAVSGTPQSECGVSTGPDGVDAWFPKPLNPKSLVDKIQRDLGIETVPA